jgi:hypothetical protein
LLIGIVRTHFFPNSYEAEEIFIVRLLLKLYGKLHGQKKLEILKKKLNRTYNDHQTIQHPKEKTQ